MSEVSDFLLVTALFWHVACLLSLPLLSDRERDMTYEWTFAGLPHALARLIRAALNDRALSRRREAGKIALQIEADYRECLQLIEWRPRELTPIGQLEEELQFERDLT